MRRARKTNRVPQNNMYVNDNLSTTSNDSNLPHLRGDPSASSPSPLRNSSSSTIPPHLRGLNTSSAASAGGASSTNPTTRESVPRGSAAKQDEPVNPARKYKCTFADCMEAFPSEALLLRHKASPMSGHDYCKTCKLDFEDDAAYHLHKMESEAHITCSICSEDFKSEGGLKRHGLQASGE